MEDGDAFGFNLIEGFHPDIIDAGTAGVFRIGQGKSSSVPITSGYRDSGSREISCRRTAERRRSVSSLVTRMSRWAKRS